MSSGSNCEEEESSSRLKTSEHSGYFVLVHESRSGSTFLGNILSRHPAISIAPESDLLRSAWRWRHRRKQPVVASNRMLEELLKDVQQDEKFRSWEVDLEHVTEEISPRLPVSIGHVVRSILCEYGRMHHPGSRHFGLKRGGWNACNIHAIAQLLPGICFLNILRDGRAVFASEKRAIHRNTGRPFQENPFAAAWRWRYYARCFRDAGESGYEIRYEDLISDPESELTGLLEFLRVDASQDVIEEMLRPHSSTYVPRYVANLHTNVGKPPLLNRIDAWRSELEKPEIRAFERIAGDVLVEKGYVLDSAKRPLDVGYRFSVNIQQQLNRRIGFHKWRKARRKRQ